MSRPPRFDIAQAEADPAAYFAALAAEAPLVRRRLPLLGPVWMTTTAEAAEEVLKSSDRFRMRLGGAAAGVRWWMPRSLRVLTRNMLSLDDPDHRRLRKSVDRAFARRDVQRMRDEIGARADALLDAMASRPAPCLVADFARPLPLRVITDLLGVPPQHEAAFLRFSAAFGGMSGLQVPWLIFVAIPRLARLTERVLDEARATPRPGLIADLLAVQDELPEPERMSREELVAMIFLLMLAGMETTTNLIAGGLLALDRSPEAKAWLMADPVGRRERVVEELARHVSSVQLTKPRFAVADTTVAGCPVRRGDKVMAAIAAANLDPARFEAPKTLRADRFPNPHLAFGTGVHFCLGMQLARVEVQEAVTRFLARFPDAWLGRPAYAGRPGQRAIRSLPVRLATA